MLELTQVAHLEHSSSHVRRTDDRTRIDPAEYSCRNSCAEGGGREGGLSFAAFPALGIGRGAEELALSVEGQAEFWAEMGEYGIIGVGGSERACREGKTEPKPRKLVSRGSSWKKWGRGMI